MSDREPYDRDSRYILTYFLPQGSIKSDIEAEYCEYYQKLHSKLLKSQFEIRYYEDLAKKDLGSTSDHFRQMLNIELYNIKLYEELLSKLELSAPIENILQRERKPNEVITMQFLNRELPNIPYNTCSTYLTDDDVSLIKRIIAKKEKDFEAFENVLKTPQTKATATPNKTQNNKTSVKNKPNYIFCAIIGCILSGFYLLGIADLEYSYYEFIRVISFILIPIFIYAYWKIEKIDDSLDRMLVYIPSGIVWLLFNPIFPVTMSKDNWIIFDVISALIFLAINIFLFFYVSL